MGTDQPKPQPIGYWLKRADELITQRSNEALQEFGLTRYHWQTLHAIQEAGRLNKEQLALMLMDFVDAAQLEEILGDLKAKAWIAYEVDRGGARLGLTAAGERAHAEALERQGQVRRRLAQGISEDEYNTLLQILQRIVENLQ